MVLVAFNVAASALQSRRGLEHVPQWLGAGLTVGGEVVEGGDKLVAFVTDVAGLLSDGQRLHWELRLLFALAFIGVKNLRDTGYFLQLLLQVQKQHAKAEKGKPEIFGEFLWHRRGTHPSE